METYYVAYPRYIAGTDELMHYGVKGMKWGVRNKRREYGMSRREVKQAVRSARQQTRAATKSAGGYRDWSARNSTGKNWDRTSKRLRDDIRNDATINKNFKKSERLKNKADRLYDKSFDRSVSGTDRKAMRAESKRLKKESNKYVKLVDRDTMRKIESYKSQYQKALLKDIKYSKDFEVGKKMLEDYGITNKRGYVDRSGNYEYRNHKLKVTR